MKFIHVLTAVALALVAIPAAASALNAHDAAYLKKAIQMQMGRYAIAAYEAQHGNGSVQKFAKSIASQSADDSRMLTSLAKKDGVTPAGGLLIQDKMHFASLQGLQGASLNRAFVRELRIADDVNQYTMKQELKHGTNPTLKAYTAKRYAAVKHELQTLKHM